MTSMGDRAGEQLRSFQDRALGHEGDQDYSSLVEGAIQERSTRVRRRNTMFGAVAALAVLFAFGALYPTDEAVEVAEAPAPAPFQVQGSEVAPSLGQEIAANDAPKAVKFNGGEMTLSPGSRGKVLSLHDLGANMELLDGEIGCNIEPGRGGKWTVRAGGYRVAVVGTVFAVRYSRVDNKFEVDVTRGIVDVTGPGITGVERLEKGDKLRLPQEDSAAQESQGTDPDRPSSPSSMQATPKSNWKALAAQGKYGEAMEQVEKTGFASTAGGLSVGDLVRLADVARMAGRSDRATELLHRIRKAAPGSHHAATAAYSLGTTAFDQRGDHAGAARWFSSYLQEAPGGPLSREALGRMMESQYRAGMTTAATDSARKYLKAYPAGPHRMLAQKLAK